MLSHTAQVDYSTRWEDLTMNIAQMDQALEAMRDLSILVRKHYEEMIKAGFTEEQALQLTVSMQLTMLGQGKGK